jgi:hypothetical protein
LFGDKSSCIPAPGPSPSASIFNQAKDFSDF